jgi:hypothetical protein
VRFHHGFNLDPRLLACKAAVVVSRLQNSPDHKEVAAFDISLSSFSQPTICLRARRRSLSIYVQQALNRAFIPRPRTMDHLQIYRAFPSGLTRHWTHRDLQAVMGVLYSRLEIAAAADGC